MTYEKMNQELADIPLFGQAAGLDNLMAYLEYLGHPERALRVIHVAGTNGKGSVCAFMESILRTAGYKTGLFTSPHLLSINERIRINFCCCENEQMASAYGEVKKLMDQRGSLHLKMLTYFEVLFLMSLLIFREEQVDYCIMETGLGGRLDATVLCNPFLTVITSISLDHVGFLGDTIEKIAREKAGIIKKNIPVVVMKEEESAFKVIQKAADEKKAPLIFVEKENIRNFKKSMNYIDFSIENRYYYKRAVRVFSAAKYQTYNAALAAVAIRSVFPDLPEEFIQRGLMDMRWEGRMEEVVPGVYVDGAHNPGAILEICDSFKDKAKQWKLLFAVCQDKDYHTMVSALSALSWHKVVITHFDSARGADARAVAEEFREKSGLEVEEYNNVRDALSHIKASEKEPVLCLGSLYLAGEIKTIYHRESESEDFDD